MATAEQAGEAIGVEIAFAAPAGVALVALRVPAGTTADEAIRRSGILERFPEIDLAVNRIGVFGRLCSGERVLSAGDRVEIYRPLAMDPKEARRQRAAKGRTADGNRHRPGRPLTPR